MQGLINGKKPAQAFFMKPVVFCAKQIANMLNPYERRIRVIFFWS